MNNVWVKTGNSFTVREVSQQLPLLPVGVYKLQVTPFQELYVDRIMDEFEFPYHIYGMEKKFIQRVHKSWNNTTGNMGVLLNGTKGTGKTVTAQLICNKMELPVIIVPFIHDRLLDFLNHIQQDVIIFIDEYEKIFNKTTMLLSIMDGVFKSNNRFMFLFTTNELYIDQNMLQRPSRIRYIKTFGDMELDVIMEVVKDKLLHSLLFNETVKFISEMPIITMDLVKSVIEEVNIHEESPYDFADVFNIHDDKQKLMNVYILLNGEKKLLKNFCSISPSYFTAYSVGEYFHIDGCRLGSIKSLISDKELLIRTCEFNFHHMEIDETDTNNLFSNLLSMFSHNIKTECSTTGTPLLETEMPSIGHSSIIYPNDEKVDNYKCLPPMTLHVMLENSVKKHKTFTNYSSLTY